MKYLIVNADDLGASPGISRGILEAHARGIVTSASLMVDEPSSADAAERARHAGKMSVGLHVVIRAGGGDRAVPEPGGSGRALRDELRRQYARFEELMGRPPTHLDSHHDVHRDPRLLEGFLELARTSNLPLRACSTVRCFSKFYGRWGGESHPEQIGVDQLSRMLADEIAEGVTELSCHPGHVDPGWVSDYAFEREVELRTLCDPGIPAVLERHGIELVSFRDLPRIGAGGAAG